MQYGHSQYTLWHKEWTALQSLSGAEGNQADQSQPWVHDDPAHWQWTVSLTEYLVIQLTNNKSPAGNAILSHCKVCLVSLLTANVS